MAIDTEEGTTKSVDSADGKAPSSKNDNKKVVKIVLIIVGVLIVLGIVSSIAIGFAIKKGAESFIDAATGSSIEINANDDGGEVTIKDKDGASITSRTGSSAALPSDFPESDVPMYRGAKIESSGDMTIGDTVTYTVTLSTEDTVSRVVSSYESEFSREGWKKTFSSNADNGSMLVFANEPKEMTLTISVQDGDDEYGTAITLSLRVGTYDN